MGLAVAVPKGLAAYDCAGEHRGWVLRRGLGKGLGVGMPTAARHGRLGRAVRGAKPPLEDARSAAAGPCGPCAHVWAPEAPAWTQANGSWGSLPTARHPVKAEDAPGGAGRASTPWTAEGPPLGRWWRTPACMWSTGRMASPGQAVQGQLVQAASLSPR